MDPPPRNVASVYHRTMQRCSPGRCYPAFARTDRRPPRIRSRLVFASEETAQPRSTCKYQEKYRRGADPRQHYSAHGTREQDKFARYRDVYTHARRLSRLRNPCGSPHGCSLLATIPLIPAKAGIQDFKRRPILSLDPRFRGDERWRGFASIHFRKGLACRRTCAWPDRRP